MLSGPPAHTPTSSWSFFSLNCLYSISAREGLAWGWIQHLECHQVCLLSG